MPAPPPPKKTSVALPPTLWHRVRVRALEEHRTASDLLVEALERYLAGKPPGPKRRPAP